MSVAADPNDLRLLVRSSDLFSWHKAEQGIYIDDLMFAGGGSPPAVFLSGNLDQQLAIRIEVEDSTTAFRWSLDENGGVWQETGVALPAGGSYALGATGVAVNFPVGTYGTTQFWNSSVRQWHDITGRPGCVFDNSTVVASAGAVYESHGLNENGVATGVTGGRPSVRFSPGMLGNEGALGTVLAGNSTPFHLFMVAEVDIMATTTQTLVLWAWTSAFGESPNTQNVIDFLMTGPSVATIGNCWGCQRIDTVPNTAQRGDSTLKPDLAPHVFEWEYDGATLTFRIDGFDVLTVAWSGTCDVNRVTLGGVKVGDDAATAFARYRLSEMALYTAALGADAPTIRQAL